MNRFISLVALLLSLPFPVLAGSGVEDEWQKQSARFDGKSAPLPPIYATPSGASRGELYPFKLRKVGFQGQELGVDVSAMDKSIRPQDDFFGFVNGTWLRNEPIPADKSRIGAFIQLDDKTREDVRRIIEEAERGSPEEGSDAQKIADLYASFMDTDTLEGLGASPVAPDLAAIDKIGDKTSLAAEIARLGAKGVDVPVGMGVDADLADATMNITQLVQAGLGMPDREYYFDPSSEMSTLRQKYVEFAAKLLALSGEADAEKKAAAVFDLEKVIAWYHWTKEEMRKPERMNNKMSLSELEALAPGFDWKAYLGAARIPETAPLLVATTSYFEGLSMLVRDRPLEDWKLYLKVRILEDAAPYLSSDFVEANFEYNGRALSGQQEMTPRWKRGVRLVDGSIGEIVGKAYVAKHFPASSKERMVELVENLRKAYGERIDEADWLSDETKKAAHEKLAKFTPKIGYPDKWRDYSSLVVKPGDLSGNLDRIAAFEYERMVAKVGKPVDRGEWHASPATVNAYYNPSANEIVFPAAILQPPFFNPAADDAVNYGAIGGVIGHEMGHGFDDQGSQFDGNGNLRDWWTTEDKDAFGERTKSLIGQYSQFEPLPGLRLNGEFTLGENIGDLAGLTIAQRAYQMSLGNSSAPVIDGFTGDQRFFLGWAQVWRGKMREKDMRSRVATDPHSPPEYRVNGVVRNVPGFYDAFGVKPGDKLFLPEKDRVKLW